VLTTDKSTLSFTGSAKRDRDRSRKYLASIAIADVIFNIINVDSSFVDLSFISFRQKEIVDLLEKSVLLSVNKEDVSADVRIFKSRFVNEIKHSEIDKALEKFRLMVQAFNNQDKILVLTQSSTIQRVSQRLIICLAAMFHFTMKLYLRDITQAYVQLATSLNRDFYV
jgi:hypothetical protein